MEAAGAEGGRSSKQRRQRYIVDLIRREAVHTQDQLVQRLQQAGLGATQATVSRDLRELRLVKVPDGEGGLRYALPEDGAPQAWSGRMRSLLADFIVSVDSSGNLVVINTLPATAAGVAEAIDRLGAPEVIGTLAGERTVFVVVKPPQAVGRFLARLQAILPEGTRVAGPED